MNFKFVGWVFVISGVIGFFIKYDMENIQDIISYCLTFQIYFIGITYLVIDNYLKEKENDTK